MIIKISIKEIKKNNNKKKRKDNIVEKSRNGSTEKKRGAIGGTAIRHSAPNSSYKIR